MAKMRFQGKQPLPIIYFASAAFEFIGFLFLPALGGYLLDTMVFTEDGDKPSYFFMGGVFLGFAFGVYHLYSVAKSLADAKFEDSGTLGKAKKQDVDVDAHRIHRELDELGDRIDSLVKRNRKSKK